MRTTYYYKVEASVAARSESVSMRYRTEDGMIILNEQDLRMIRLEPEEYLNGIVDSILTEEEALLLIQQGGHKMGLLVEDSDMEEPVQEEAQAELDEDNEGFEVKESERNVEDIVELIEEEMTNE